MRSGLEKHVALWLVFAAGIAAAVYGIYLLVGLRDLAQASLETVGGLALVAWVLFHPARVPEESRSEI